MSKIIYACYRRKLINPEIKQKILEICKELNPDNIDAHPTDIFFKNNIIYGIANPLPTLTKSDINIVLGKLFEESDDWKNLSATAPDGNYAIFRTDNNTIEILTDCLGTRTVWYYIDEEVFVASTSQKAIIGLIGNFQFNESIIPWMFSTGTLGPDFSWDKRLKRIPSDGKLSLFIENWDLQLNYTPVIFSTSVKSKKEHKVLLREALKKTFSNISLEFKNWVITLSGGHDSRAVLLLFKKYSKYYKSDLKSITWGTKSSILNKKSDAYIAQTLAQNQQTKHTYYSTEDTNENIEMIVERFLRNGEGRIDHITGYLDGFKIWKKIFEQNIYGVVRGDEVFGYNKIYSPLVVNSFMGLTLCLDYSNLSKYKYINSLQQEIPKELKQKSDESLPTWRDRIFQSYRIPYAQSALADLKYAYVEQVNPFLSRKIVMVTRQLPDSLRTDKKLFKSIMKTLDPGIPFSKKDSNVLLKDAVKNEEFITVIKNELSSPYAKTIFPPNFLEHIIKNIKIGEEEKKYGSFSLISFLKKKVPLKIKKYFAQQQKNLILNENILAFRVFIICRMHKNLEKFSREKL